MSSTRQTGFFELDHLYKSDIGGSDYASSLPIQTLPRYKKNDDWGREVMDRLEEIGLYQLSKNIAFRDYRDMFEGRLVYQDFDDTLSTTQDIAKFREEELNLPTYIKHFDLIGIIVKQLAGELDKQKDLIRVDSIDSFSRAELFREKNTQIRKYTQDYFQLELQRLLVLKGINPNKQDFNSEEEKQAYIQYLEEEKSKLIPPRVIDQQLSKSFKTIMTEWGEYVLESDKIKHDLDTADYEDIVDYLLTGRYFRHFHIGYDYYKPDVGKDRWTPETTFFSQDLGIVHPQDGEYVGRVLFISGSEVLERYGDKLPKNIQEKVYGYNINSTKQGSYSFKQAMRKGFSEHHLTPDPAYYQRDLAYKYQSALNIPMGELYTKDSEGEYQAHPHFLENDHNHNFIGTRYTQHLRKDIEVRTDLLQVTEAYWKSKKLMGLLTIENDFTDEPNQIIVDEDLLKEFLKENEIKQYRTVSLEEAKENKELNTIAWFYVPEVWQGKKISSTNSFLPEDIWFDIKPLPFQIKGDSEYYDLKLPVAGLITSSIAQKLRPYQIEYNIAMNMIRNSMEKHIGAFLMFDYNFLPSQYKNEFGEDTAELVEKFTQNIKDLGFEFYDSSPQNTMGQNPNAAIIQKQSISFVEDMQYYSQMAQFYKSLALEQIGITPQRLGTPSEYMSAEGIRQGVQASYAQTEGIYKKFNTAKRKETEIHLNVAQYCVKDNKNIIVDYIRDDGSRILKKFTDDDFYLRKINITATNDSEQRRNLETFRNMMLQNNTLDNDLLDYAQIFNSKSFKTLLDHASFSRDERNKKVREERQHQQVMMDKQLQAKQQEKLMDMEFEASENQKDRIKDLKEAEIQAVARAADNNADPKLIATISKIASDRIQKEQKGKALDLKEREVDLKQKTVESQLQAQLREDNLKAEQLKLRREEMDTKRFTSLINKN